MNTEQILNKIKKLSLKEKQNLNYGELIKIINKLSADEIIKLSNIIGYPVFTRLCMEELKHKFVLLQEGAAAIIVNDKGQYYYKEEQLKIVGDYLVVVKN